MACDEANARAAQAACICLEDAPATVGRCAAVWYRGLSSCLIDLLRRRSAAAATLPPGLLCRRRPKPPGFRLPMGRSYQPHWSPHPAHDPRIRAELFLCPSAATRGSCRGRTSWPICRRPHVSGWCPAPAIVWGAREDLGLCPTGTDRFVRREVPTENPYTMMVRHEGVSAGDRLVVRGAQALLSEEFRAGFRSVDEGARDMKPERRQRAPFVRVSPAVPRRIDRPGLYLFGTVVHTGAAPPTTVFPRVCATQASFRPRRPGWTPEQVSLVTQLLENALNGLAGIESLQSGSIQGPSSLP